MLFKRVFGRSLFFLSTYELLKISIYSVLKKIIFHHLKILRGGLALIREDRQISLWVLWGESMKEGFNAWDNTKSEQSAIRGDLQSVCKNFHVVLISELDVSSPFVVTSSVQVQLNNLKWDNWIQNNFPKISFWFSLCKDSFSTLEDNQ